MTEQRGDRRPVRRVVADVMRANGSLWVDQHIPAKLIHVTGRPANFTAATHQLNIRPQTCGAENSIPAAAGHAVRFVKPTIGVDQQRPFEVGFAIIRPGEIVPFERYDEHSNSEQLDFLFVLPQLRQVLAARQSAQMAVKHQQQPAAPIILESMNVAVGVG